MRNHEDRPVNHGPPQGLRGSRMHLFSRLKDSVQTTNAMAQGPRKLKAKRRF